jgi:APA family basic amino acid/polyamine antiporter
MTSKTGIGEVSEEQANLHREIGLFQLVAYGVGNIVGAGIYVLVGEASGLAGGMVWLSFLAGAVIALFTGLSYAELGAMYPRAASEYIFLGRAYGSRLLSFITEWTMLLTEVVAAAAVSLGFASYLKSLTGLPVIPSAIGLLVILAALVAGGIKQSMRVNTVLSVVAVLGLLVIVGLWLSGAGDRPADVSFTETPDGFSGVVAAMALIFFAYVGFDNITNVAEETRDPQRLIPRGLLIAVALSTILYVLVGFAAVALAGWQALADSDAPLALAASNVWGEPAADALAVIALVTTFNTCLVLFIVASRIIYGMAREHVLPQAAGRVHRTTGAPYVAVLVVLAAATCFLSLGSIGAVAKVTSFGSLFTFALVNLAMLHLRRVAPNHERPFRSPLSVGWLSVTGVLGLVSCLALMTQFDAPSVLLGLLLPASGIAMFVAYGRRQPAVDAGAFHESHERRP